jgi:hypothetical protein
MFGFKARAEKVSESRFCMIAPELPYNKIYGHGRFTVALSKLSRYRSWPARDYSEEETSAVGVLHGSVTFPDTVEEEPWLPVKVTFFKNRSEEKRFGHAYFDRSSVQGVYLLQVDISDPQGEIFQSVQAAMQRSVISNNNFVHLHCTQDRDPSSYLPDREGKDWQTQHQEDRDFLRRVEAGEARLPTIVFDRVSFEDALITSAPDWTWRGWQEWAFEPPRFLSKATGKWRRKSLPYRLK